MGEGAPLFINSQRSNASPERRGSQTPDKPAQPGTRKEDTLVWERRADVLNAIRNNPTVILAAGTATGKTRVGSQLMLEAIGPKGKMVMTENLREATNRSANIVAKDMGVRVGQEVGVRNRYMHEESAKTRLLFCPVKSLLIEMEKDKLLEKYDLISMDEVHKESKENELCMIALRDIQAKRANSSRPLKLVFVSATADEAKLIKNFSGAAKVEIPGKSFPIDEVFEAPGSPEIPAEKLPEAAAKKVVESIGRKDKGNMLVFLSGRAQIDKAHEELTRQLQGLNDTNTVIIPYYGSMPKAEQEKIFKSAGGKRIVILATNAAQESLTLDINVVIDTCMHKHKQLDLATGQEYLIEKKAPLDHLTQRKGRVGRNERKDGFKDRYYALTTEAKWNSRDAHEKAEMTRTDLTSEILIMMADGYNPRTFPYINKPLDAHINIALERLRRIGAVKDGQLTEKGKLMAQLELRPNLSGLVVSGMENGCAKQAAVLAAMLEKYYDIFSSNKDKPLNALLAQYRQPNSDLLGMIQLFNEYRNSPGDKTKWLSDRGLDDIKMKETAELYDELLKTVQTIKPNVNLQTQPATGSIDKSIYEAFADSVVSLVAGGQYKLIGMPDAPVMRIDRDSILANDPPPIFVTANIRPQEKDNIIENRFASLNHVIPADVINEAAKEIGSDKSQNDKSASGGASSTADVSEKNEEENKEQAAKEEPQPPKKMGIWNRFKSWFQNTWLGKLLRKL